MMARHMTKLLNLSAVQDAALPTLCVRGEPDNLDTLRDGRERGNHRKATEAYIQQLMAVIDVEPSELGYEFGCWTGASVS